MPEAKVYPHSILGPPSSTWVARAQCHGATPHWGMTDPVISHPASLIRPPPTGPRILAIDAFQSPMLILLPSPFNNLEGTGGGIPNVGRQESRAEPRFCSRESGLSPVTIGV
ncbi:hypothetical protein DPEC_G00253970 [Dallia pectoralis]|uniref:Uncharacterized protein n=1 Tax=Dallia pectoralis TaxID=75939 RepID=A0ACC2FU79_DALPE|nr:hypothetical protein DPEC_G00253970 [Dallia pectoralis]